MTWQFLFCACAAEWLRAVCRSHTPLKMRLIGAQRKPQIPARYALFAQQIKRPAGATGENGSIPTPHRRAETKPEEQPIGSSFRTFSPSSAVQIGDQSWMNANVSPRFQQVIAQLCKSYCP
jgi:hypothetical protein